MSDLRTRELAAIHVGKKALALDDEAYRDLLERVGGKRSSAELDPHGRQAVIEEMRRLGAPTAKEHKGKPNNLGVHPMLAKIEAFLAEAKREWAYADGIARQMFKVDRCQFLDERQLRAVLAALHRDAERHGRRTK